MILALLIMALLSVLGIALLTGAAMEQGIAYNALWGEGALTAAEAGVNRGANQLSANTTTSLAAIPTGTLASGKYSYQMGGTADPTPGGLSFVNDRQSVGYSVAVGTGYNESGYVFKTYQITATGSGPANAQRQVQVQIEYGPVAQ